MLKILYFDTSCLAKICFPDEPGADELAGYLEENHANVFVSSELASIEFLSLMRRKNLEGNISDEGKYLARATWMDLERKIALKPVTTSIIQQAKDVIRHTSVSGRVRSLDCIHFATFLEYNEEFPDTILLSSDKTMCQLAEEKRLEFFNPLSP